MKPLPNSSMTTSVSIPLRGRCNVNGCYMVQKPRNVLVFPSPCGEDVMSTIRGYSYKPQPSLFPSPCGEDVMSTLHSALQPRSLMIWVSIPLRGRCNVNLKRATRKNLTSIKKFPSPCGEDVMSTFLGTEDQKPVGCFHPLAGKM